MSPVLVVDFRTADERVEAVAQHTVAEVVAQPGDLAAQHFRVRDVELRLPVFETLREVPGQV